MTDRSNARIIIGGSLTTDDLEILVEAIKDDDIGDESGEPFFDDSEIREALLLAIEAKAPL